MCAVECVRMTMGISEYWRIIIMSHVHQARLYQQDSLDIGIRELRTPLCIVELWYQHVGLCQTVIDCRLASSAVTHT
jgi:hypothetical protein